MVAFFKMSRGKVPAYQITRDNVEDLLGRDFGFAFSDTWACQMLEKWFDSEAYCYMGAHLGNLPWMIAYFAPALNLYGQAIGTESELAQHIRINVPHAGISAAGRLEKGRGFYRLDLQSLHHKAVVDASDGSFTEQLTLRVQDFTKTNEASRAPTIFKKQIVFSPARFEALIHTPPERAKRNENMLGYAQAIATKRGHDVSIISKTD